MAYNAGASTGNLVLLSKQTANNSVSLDFTTGITGFDVYYIDFYGAQNATDGAALLIRVSTDGGSSYSAAGYDVTNYYSFPGSLSQGTTGAVTGFRLSDNNNNTDAAMPIVGSAFLYNFSNSSFKKQCISTFMGNSNGNTLLSQQGTIWSTTTAVNAIQVIASSGNITSGTFKLYGVAN